MDPTLDPTSYPTAAPTHTDTVVYVRWDGCDNGKCNSSNTTFEDAECNGTYSDSTPSPTCESIDYGWSCFLGIEDDCSDYDGNGEFNLGAGTWDFPYSLDVEDGDVAIVGQGPSNTTLTYSGSNNEWIKCRFGFMCQC